MKPHIHFERGIWWWTLGGTIISFRTIQHIIAWQRICRPRIENVKAKPCNDHMGDCMGIDPDPYGD